MVELTTNGLELRSMALFHGHELRRPWFICCAHEVHAKGGEPKGALEVELGERRPPLVGALAVRNHHVEAVVVNVASKGATTWCKCSGTTPVADDRN